VIVAEDPPTNNYGTQEQPPARQDVDVILDVSELEVDRIKLTVRNLRAHVSVLAELASLLSLQVGVDARLEDTELEIEGVRAKLLLKVCLDDIRAILREALQTVAEHPQILRILTRALDELVTERIGDALGTLQSALGALEGDGPRRGGGSQGQAGRRARLPPEGLGRAGRPGPRRKVRSWRCARGFLYLRSRGAQWS